MSKKSDRTRGRAIMIRHLDQREKPTASMFYEGAIPASQRRGDDTNRTLWHLDPPYRGAYGFGIEDGDTEHADLFMEDDPHRIRMLTDTSWVVVSKGGFPGDPETLAFPADEDGDYTLNEIHGIRGEVEAEDLLGIMGYDTISKATNPTHVATADRLACGEHG